MSGPVVVNGGRDVLAAIRAEAPGAPEPWGQFLHAAGDEIARLREESATYSAGLHQLGNELQLCRAQCPAWQRASRHNRAAIFGSSHSHREPGDRERGSGRPLPAAAPAGK